MESFEERYEPLLARRVPLEDVVVGRAYVIHARNGGVGVAVQEGGELGYRLHRVKLGSHFLFVEYDWAQGPPVRYGHSAQSNQRRTAARRCRIAEMAC